jgi:glucosamine kinase
MSNILIADSGATKTEWCLIINGKKRGINTQGLSPYFLNITQIVEILNKELCKKIKDIAINEIYFFGTGCSNKPNQTIVAKALKQLFPIAKIHVDHDMLGAAKSVCHQSKGVACILGTGSSACFFDGKKITKSRTGLGYALGDEGSGSYLGRKIIQYYLYDTFDADLKLAFEKRFNVDKSIILENVYKKPFPQRYIASFCVFLSENRGHFMIENIIEDGLIDFFFKHLIKFNESWKYPVHFVGSIAYHFKDVVKDLCNNYGFEMGTVIKKPMIGLAQFYIQKSK